MPLPSSLKKPLLFFRSSTLPLATGAPSVDYQGGKQGAGVIRGASAISAGEALGHGMWIDNHMLEQVAAAMAVKPTKVRFTHPGLSSDGLGKYLGVATSPRMLPANALGKIPRVAVDVEFSSSSRATPDGDLGGYVMALAEENPSAVGLSIVYEPDHTEEDQFYADNSIIEDGVAVFRSPDKLNVKNLPHARVATMRAVDVVDDPAANPDGMFHRDSQIIQEARQIASFALGLEADRPVCESLSAIDPDRIRAFVARFLDEHKLEIRPKETSMSAETPIAAADLIPPSVDELETEVVSEEAEHPAAEEPQPVPVSSEPEVVAAMSSSAIKAAAQPFIKLFGEQMGAVLFASGQTLEAAKDAFICSLREENSKLAAKVSAFDSTGVSTEGVSFTDGDIPKKTQAIRLAHR